MNADLQSFFREELTARKQRLLSIVATDAESRLSGLLREVDGALRRIEGGEYGLCQTCHEPVEQDRLIADPLVSFCLDHLSEREQRALEQDLALASRIQRGLLPRTDQPFGPWDIHFSFEPAGLVSGDYCDLIPGHENDVLILLGDVAGKGVAASMLMSQLHGMFRTLASVESNLSALMERASRMFCESTLPTHYATLICGRAHADGRIEMCNAGHPSALLARGDVVERLQSTSLPLGLFCEGQFEVETVLLEPGNTLVLFSDGFTEAEDAGGEEFGLDRLSAAVRESAPLTARSLVEGCKIRLGEYLADQNPHDDRTLLAARFAPEGKAFAAEALRIGRG